MDLNKYLNKAALPETQYSKEEYAAMKKTEREAVWVQVDARMGEVLADAPTLQGFLDFMSQCRNSLPNQLLLSGQNADITDARTFQQWKDAGRHIRTGEEGYTAIVGQVYENDGRKASGYNIGKVFDITQTRGRPVPPPAEYQVDELVAAAIESSPVPIQVSDSLPDGIQAQYVPKNRTIYVRNGMDAGTTLCAIVRECAQADFHKDYTY
uniref:ArdC family protein n=1 Tax=Ruthenibacterium lactatiformans TaxID=1550024 RepID=UPI003AB8379D